MELCEASLRARFFMGAGMFPYLLVFYGGDDGDLAFVRLMLIPSELTLFGRIPKNHSQDGFLNGIPL